ncbi:MAG: rhodanese-like domain-containing protein [Gammaproteobacteria bacterium]|nr:rhodanese-like domain-containing protein [Gammaproteobacteria bacterium]
MFLRLFISSLVLLTLSACAEPPYNNLDNKQLKTLLAQGVPIYDVRRVDEWRSTGIIESSQLLTFVGGDARLSPDFMPRFTTAVNRHDPVILICRTGNRTSKLAQYLVEELGYTQVYNVRHGITHWISDGNPVVRAGL